MMMTQVKVQLESELFPNNSSCVMYSLFFISLLMKYLSVVANVDLKQFFHL